MEQTNVVFYIDKIKRVGGSKNSLVLDGTERSGDVAGTGADGAVDIVGEGEESIRGQGDAGVFGEPLLTFFGRKRFWEFSKLGLVFFLFGAAGGDLVADVEVNCVALVGTLSAFSPLESEDAGMLAEPPVVGLVASETSAVDARLLAGTETNDHTALCVADRV